MRFSVGIGENGERICVRDPFAIERFKQAKCSEFTIYTFPDYLRSQQLDADSLEQIRNSANFGVPEFYGRSIFKVKMEGGKIAETGHEVTSATCVERVVADEEHSFRFSRSYERKTTQLTKNQLYTHVDLR